METKELPRLEDLTTVIRGGFIVPKNDLIGSWQIEKQDLTHCTHLPGVISEHLKPGDLCLDIGAYDGDLTRTMSNCVGDTGMVIAAEAGKLQFECLKHNCQFFQHKNVFPIQTAISEVNGSTVAHESNSTGNIGASICKDIPDEMRKEGHTYLLTTTIDYLVHQSQRRCNFIKMDIEGWEFKALIGAAETLKRYHPKMIIEINSSALLLQGDTPEDIFTMLGMYKYDWEILQKECKLGDPMFDILCLPI